MPSRSAARSPAPILRPDAQSPPSPEEETTTGEGLHELVVELQEWRKIVAPAAEAVAGFGERLDTLCAWFKGKWPWILALGWVAIQQAANMTPEAAEAAFNAVATAAKSAGGAP